MRLFAIFVIVLCFSMVLANQNALLKAASQLTKRSIVPRERCDISFFLHYPSDCEQALKSFHPNSASQGFVVPPKLCEPRCGQPAVNFYISCGLDFVVPRFVALCGTNAMGQRCAANTVQMALNTTSTDIVTDCFDAVFGSNCTADCRNTLTSARMSLGCCLHVLNTTDIGFGNPAFNRQLWEQSCGVNVPSTCIGGLKATITNGGVTLLVTKAVFAGALLLLGTLMF